MVKKILFPILLFTIFLSLSAKEELRDYKLINADSLIIYKIDEFHHTKLIGNVHFFYGTTEFYCNNADIDEKDKISKMIGNVKVYEDTLSIFADEAEYYRNRETIYLRKNVKMVQLLPDSTKNKFYADYITYKRNDSLAIAENNVKAVSEKQNISGECGYLKYYLNKHYGFMNKKPHIIRKEKDKLFEIYAQKIEYFDDYKKIVASYDVRTSFDNYNIDGNFLLYYSEDEKATVIGNPKYYSDIATAYSRQFDFHLKENKIQTVDLTDSCKVYYKIKDSDSLQDNYIFAKKIHFKFNDEKLQRVTAIEDITTYYNQKKSEKSDFVKNWVNGDSLTIKMEDDNVKYLKLINAKEGKYYFEAQK